MDGDGGDGDGRWRQWWMGTRLMVLHGKDGDGGEWG